jgi:hypothetical protein
MGKRSSVEDTRVVLNPVTTSAAVAHEKLYELSHGCRLEVSYSDTSSITHMRYSSTSFRLSTSRVVITHHPLVTYRGLTYSTRVT